MTLTPILNKLELFLNPEQSVSGKLLQPGLSENNIREKITTLPITFPKEIFELYQWKNGIAGNHDARIGQQEIFPLGIFDSLEETIQTYKYYTSKGHFSLNLFPLFSSGGGDFVLVNLDSDSTQYGYIYLYSPVLYHEDLESMYSSLNNLFNCVLECYQAGAYYFEDGGLEVADELADPIEAKYQLRED